jgi:hypothetical protein
MKADYVNKKTIRKRLMLKDPVEGNKSIVIKLFDEFYSILISARDNFGDLRKTVVYG